MYSKKAVDEKMTELCKEIAELFGLDVREFWVRISFVRKEDEKTVRPGYRW